MSRDERSLSARKGRFSTLKRCIFSNICQQEQLVWNKLNVMKLGNAIQLNLKSFRNRQHSKRLNANIANMTKYLHEYIIKHDNVLPFISMMLTTDLQTKVVSFLQVLRRLS